MGTLAILAFLWFNGASPVSLSVSRNADPVVGVAVEMLQGDLEEVTDMTTRRAAPGTATIRIIQYDKEKANLRRLGVPSDVADSLGFVKEAFYVGTHGSQIVVVGSDGRGTAYGALEVSRLAGVSPWIWWGDSRPQKRSCLELPEGFSTFQHPSVEYRGFFLNDEDWSFRPWSTMTFSPQENPGTISADTYRELFRLLLRLRANTIWPGMHNFTTPFFKIPGAREAADSCGIFIGTSHCEPLLRNNVEEWSVAERGPYNYITNSQSVKDYWTERLIEMKGRDALYTIGMRGIHDGSMEGVKTMEEKTVALQKVIDDQRELLRKYSDKDLSRVPQMFMPYKEVLEIMENGLNVPEDVTIVWCDDNYGYMTRLSDTEQQKRSGGAGVYYHLSYAGRPHDCLWLSTTQPGLIYHEMRQAYDHNVRKLWIVNVHDPKVASYDLEFFLDMAWNVDFTGPRSINSHLVSWLEREYGSAVAQKLAEVMPEFYRLASMRRPEFMGWSQVELADKKRYPGGLSQVSNTEFSFSEFGDEAQRYIDSFRALVAEVREAGALVPERSRDAYFAGIVYPVEATAAMAEKMLYAQKSRQRALTTYAPGVWRTDTVMMAAAARSQTAYQKIRSLTRYYNEELAGGRWRGMMSDRPRDLYVFRAPLLPVALTEAECGQWGEYAAEWKAGELASSGEDYAAFNACDYASASVEVTPVQNLGHSGNAVPVSKGGKLEYSFSTDASGDAVLRVALIPTQANDRGDIRFCVAVDGAEAQVFSIKEPFRSERWKKNVMRGQAVVEIPLKLSAGSHTLSLGAVDDHIIFDQWMIDFKAGRKFYLFPIR